MADKRILVVGFGNTLLRDEGVGVHLVGDLQSRGGFPQTVEFRRGGTSSLDIIPYLAGIDHLIIVDAMKGGDKPGTVYRLTPAELKTTEVSGLSLHQLDVSQTLALAARLGYNTPTTILGIEPFNMTDHSLELSPVLQAKMPEYLKILEDLVKEIAA